MYVRCVFWLYVCTVYTYRLAYFSLGKYRDAVTQYKKAVELEPGNQGCVTEGKEEGAGRRARERGERVRRERGEKGERGRGRRGREEEQER